MRIWAPCDMHIDASDSRYPQIAGFLDVVDEVKPDILVLNGDIGDPWKDLWEAIVASKTWQRLRRTVNKRRPLETIWIPENHDWSGRPEYLPGAEIVRERFDVLDLTFMHGWQFAIDWNIIHKFCFWLVRNRPIQAVRLYEALYGKRTPSVLKAQLPVELRIQEGATARPDEWSQAKGLIHHRARTWAQANNRRLFIGHTHCPTPFDGLIIDGGDWVDSMTCPQYLDGDISLMRFTE